MSGRGSCGDAQSAEVFEIRMERSDDFAQRLPAGLGHRQPQTRLVVRLEGLSQLGIERSERSVEFVYPLALTEELVQEQPRGNGDGQGGIGDDGLDVECEGVASSFAQGGHILAQFGDFGTDAEHEALRARILTRQLALLAKRQGIGRWNLRQSIRTGRCCLDRDGRYRRLLGTWAATDAKQHSG